MCRRDRQVKDYRHPHSLERLLCAISDWCSPPDADLHLAVTEWLRRLSACITHIAGTPILSPVMVPSDAMEAPLDQLRNALGLGRA